MMTIEERDILIRAKGALLLSRVAIARGISADGRISENAPPIGSLIGNVLREIDGILEVNTVLEKAMENRR
jgi:hypothetical protein